MNIAASARAAAVAIVGMGFPLSQLAVRRWGHAAAASVAAISFAALADASVRAAVEQDPRQRRLLAGEATAAAAAVATGALLLRDPEVRAARVNGWRVGPAELIRRTALGTMFGLRSARMGAPAVAGLLPRDA